MGLNGAFVIFGGILGMFQLFITIASAMSDATPATLIACWFEMRTSGNWRLVLPIRAKGRGVYARGVCQGGALGCAGSVREAFAEGGRFLQAMLCQDRSCRLSLYDCHSCVCRVCQALNRIMAVINL